eukprot:GHVN01083842.1.p4 GENE.GHVN01083842.1~~GHVN01083842.1.p4  ORF type:complete len:139 (+),score=18.71 GHVN01083842.1:171-587(+)
MGCSKSKSKVDHPQSTTIASPNTSTQSPGGGMTKPVPDSPPDARIANYNLQTTEPKGGDFPDQHDEAAPLVTRGPVSLPDSVIYTGQWKGRRKHGHGVQKWPDGAEFDGEWLNGMAHGIDISSMWTKRIDSPHPPHCE